MSEIDVQEAEIKHEPARYQAPETPFEQYWWVRFHSKSEAQQTERVELFCNGEALVITREKDIVLPQRFLEVADHTLYAHHRFMPGETSKYTTWVKTYPYTKLRPATEAEFIRMRDEGTKKLRALLKEEQED